MAKMPRLHPNDKGPRSLFGKRYLWLLDEDGKMYLGKLDDNGDPRSMFLLNIVNESLKSRRVPPKSEQ